MGRRLIDDMLNGYARLTKSFLRPTPMQQFIAEFARQEKQRRETPFPVVRSPRTRKEEPGIFVPMTVEHEQKVRKYAESIGKPPGHFIAELFLVGFQKLCDEIEKTTAKPKAGFKRGNDR